jgi:hypothetical protein
MRCLYGRAWRLTAENGVSRPGQFNKAAGTRVAIVATAAPGVAVVLTPPCVFHRWFSIENVQGGVTMAFNVRAQATGAGGAFINALLGVPGASATVLEAVVLGLYPIVTSQHGSSTLYQIIPIIFSSCLPKVAVGCTPRWSPTPSRRRPTTWATRRTPRSGRRARATLRRRRWRGPRPCAPRPR